MTFRETDWPYVCYTKHDWVDVAEWCAVNIGDFDRDWYKLGEDSLAQFLNKDYKSTYYFRRSEDATMFLLRWGC